MATKPLRVRCSPDRLSLCGPAPGGYPTISASSSTPRQISRRSPRCSPDKSLLDTELKRLFVLFNGNGRVTGGGKIPVDEFARAQRLLADLVVADEFAKGQKVDRSLDRILQEDVDRNLQKDRSLQSDVDPFAEAEADTGGYADSPRFGESALSHSCLTFGVSAPTHSVSQKSSSVTVPRHVGFGEESCVYSVEATTPRSIRPSLRASVAGTRARPFDSIRIAEGARRTPRISSVDTALYSHAGDPYEYSVSSRASAPLAGTGSYPVDLGRISAPSSHRVDFGRLSAPSSQGGSLRAAASLDKTMTSRSGAFTARTAKHSNPGPAHLSEKQSPKDSATFLAAMCGSDAGRLCDDDGLGFVSFTIFKDWLLRLLHQPGQSHFAQCELLAYAGTQLRRARDRAVHRTNLYSATLTTSLQSAIEEAASALRQEELDPYVDKLNRWQALFPVYLVLMTGGRHEVEVTRSQTVRALRQRASDLFGVELYRVAMACDTGSLEPDSVTLEARGVTLPHMEISTVIQDEEPLMHMAIWEFLEKVSNYELASPQAVATLQRRLGHFPEEEISCRARYLPRMKALEAKAQAAQMEAAAANAEAVSLTQDRVSQEAEQREWVVQVGQLMDVTAWPQRLESFVDLPLVELLAYGVEAGVLSEKVAMSATGGSGGPKYRTLLMEHVACMGAIRLWSKEVQRLRESIRSAEEESACESMHSTELRHAAEQYLEQATPGLRAAEHALQSLSKHDFTDIRAFKQPPPAVMKVVDAVCLLLRSPLRGDSVQTRWQVARTTILSDPQFLIRLLTFDRDNIDDEVVRRLEVFINGEEFSSENLRRISKAATGLCMWVRAVSLYHSVFQLIRPKRAAVHRMESRIEIRTAALENRTEMLKVSEDNLDLLRSELANYGSLSHFLVEPETVAERILRKDINGSSGTFSSGHFNAQVAERERLLVEDERLLEETRMVAALSQSPQSGGQSAETPHAYPGSPLNLHLARLSSLDVDASSQLTLSASSHASSPTHRASGDSARPSLWPLPMPMSSAEETLLVQPSMEATTAVPCMEATMPVRPSMANRVTSVDVASQQVPMVPVSMPSNITFPEAVFSVSSSVATTSPLKSEKPDVAQLGVVMQSANE